jgi:uncharacterized protein
MQRLVDRELVERCEQVVRQRMAGQAAGHGLDHILRVLAMARLIQSQAGGDLFVIELAAWLHDIGDAKFHDGVERSGEFAREILGRLGADDDVIEHVVRIVDNLSFRKRQEAETLSLEGKIVQDADRLDALGAIGIVRTIEYGAAVGQPFYLAEDWINGDENSRTGIGHFHQKLFKLKDLMNTQVARQMAEQREAFMRQFLDQFLRQCAGQV